MRLFLVASKPTNAVTYGFLPAAARLGLDVYLLTDQPDAHAGSLAGQPNIAGCDVHDARALISAAAGGGPGGVRAGGRVRLEHLTPWFPHAPAAHVPLSVTTSMRRNKPDFGIGG